MKWNGKRKRPTQLPNHIDNHVKTTNKYSVKLHAAVTFCFNKSIAFTINQNNIKFKAIYQETKVQNRAMCVNYNHARLKYTLNMLLLVISATY